MLGTLRRALCADTGIAYFQQVADEEVALASNQLANTREERWLALTCNRLAEAALRLRLLTDEGVSEGRAARPEDKRATAEASADHRQNQPGSVRSRLLSTTRQAIQVALAAALATLAGTLLSSNRWYWAVLTAFVIFSGTASRGETLVKAWQRVVGTLTGVVIGVVLAALVGGNVVVSVVFIFVALFMTFY